MDLQTPRIEQELIHLLRLVGQPSMPAWEAYSKWKADHMASHDPVTFGALPLMLSNSLKQLKDSAKSG